MSSPPDIGSPDPLPAALLAWREQVRALLDAEIDSASIPAPLREAVRYGSTAPPASRWRAVVVLEVGRVVRADADACLLAAAAVEALHCATLSVDDLPCMDDAQERRGRPAMHRRFNEALAIQAALWLLGLSRTLMARAATKAGRVSAAFDPLGAAGALANLQQTTEDALHRGQFLDMLGTLGRSDVVPEEVARLKCGRLFALAAAVPAWLPQREAGANDLAATLDAFGEALGIAYQIRDDLADHGEDDRATSWTEDAGGRPTVVAAAGREAAAARIGDHLGRALASLMPLDGRGIDAAPLHRLATTILGRAAD